MGQVVLRFIFILKNMIYNDHIYTYIYIYIYTFFIVYKQIKNDMQIFLGDCSLNEMIEESVHSFENARPRSYIGICFMHKPIFALKQS